MKKVQRNSDKVVLLQNHNLHGRQHHPAREELTDRAPIFSAMNHVEFEPVVFGSRNAAVCATPYG